MGTKTNGTAATRGEATGAVSTGAAAIEATVME